VGNKTSFTYSMLRGAVMDPNKISENTPAVFIKVDRESHLPQKCWEGLILKVTRTSNKVWFEFKLDNVIECPPKYIGSPDGWYTDESS
jgi:hypothetical protein